METFTLNKNQQATFDQIESPESWNYLVQGKPGVGKSVLIDALTRLGDKKYTLAATTGLAALNIGGFTLHSIFGLPVVDGIMHEDYNQFPTDDKLINRVRGIKTLIVDECSMIRADMFDYLERFCRFARGIDKPFGGMQVVLVGDFYQLPPIVNGVDLKQMKEAGYDSPFVFSAKCFNAFKILSLHEVLRQKDPKFINMLDEARSGFVSAKSLALVNKCVAPIAPGDLRISLVTKNKISDAINWDRLTKLEGTLQTYDAEKFGHWPALPAEEVLKLKIGAQVMIKKNGADRPPKLEPGTKFKSQVVNGSIGIVTGMQKDRVFVELKNGTEVTIYRQRWEREKLNRVDGKLVKEVVASFAQIPISLSWAISMHKSQGQSFDYVHIDPKGIFADGQMYVALSRCRTLEGLSLESPCKATHFRTSKFVTEFFDRHAEAA